MSYRSDAVVVTYQPDIASLHRLIVALAPQVGTITIVDNGSTNLGEWQYQLPGDNVQVLAQHANLGIASAINAGFEAVRRRGTAQFVALFDQDSTPSDSMINRLERYCDELASRGPVAQVGPYFFEHNRGHHLPFIEFKRGFPRRKHLRGEERWTTADYLISSGALIPLHAIDKVGPLDDTLFIDYVDIEWGLRAKAAGFQSYGAFDVRMEHAIGEKALDLAVVRLAMHKPIRRYYYYRNALLLCRRSYVPVSWKLHEVARLALKFWIFALFSRNRAPDVRMMLKGITDGVLGRTGKLQDKLNPR
ncbi:glycosyltransferase family 2 protein [Trinickia terrae]|uniref:Glycosyltransferase family 2 protein n=1 Tax=Trinickia terrae TaxID=2571161 RepID=A0A4U1IDR5_9BURK|nr:glycosyltransferase family 2 protein [Trinickia terrae]TKC91791.1 glycosyltransferase family 2 protein [Trinickia terrae]